MKTTKNLKDLKSKTILRVHNIGAGGVDKFGSTYQNGIKTIRIIQEIRRNIKLSDNLYNI